MECGRQGYDSYMREIPTLGYYFYTEEPEMGIYEIIGDYKQFDYKHCKNNA